VGFDGEVCKKVWAPAKGSGAVVSETGKKKGDGWAGRGHAKKERSEGERGRGKGRREREREGRRRRRKGEEEEEVGEEGEVEVERDKLKSEGPRWYEKRGSWHKNWSLHLLRRGANSKAWVGREKRRRGDQSTKKGEKKKSCHTTSSR